MLESGLWVKSLSPGCVYAGIKKHTVFAAAEALSLITRLPITKKLLVAGQFFIAYGI